MSEKIKKKRKEPVRQRNKPIHIRLTADEAAELKTAAATANKSVADFVVSAARGETLICLPGGADIYAELKRQGNNLNQVVKLSWENEGKPVPELDQALQKHLQIQQKIMDFISDLEVIATKIREMENVNNNNQA